jgi:hypothetical protein
MPRSGPRRLPVSVTPRLALQRQSPAGGAEPPPRAPIAPRQRLRRRVQLERQRRLHGLAGGPTE